jgi:hypothetical protein
MSPHAVGHLRGDLVGELSSLRGEIGGTFRRPRTWTSRLEAETEYGKAGGDGQSPRDPPDPPVGQHRCGTPAKPKARRGRKRPERSRGVPETVGRHSPHPVRHRAGVRHRPQLQPVDSARRIGPRRRRTPRAGRTHERGPSHPVDIHTACDPGLAGCATHAPVHAPDLRVGRS